MPRAARRLLASPAAARGRSARAARAQPRPRALRLPPEERRAQLVASGVRVLARRGLGAASLTDVAREAGVSVPAVFFYFKTREALIDAVLEDVAQLYLGLAEQFLSGDTAAPEALSEFSRAFATSVDARPDHARVWLDWSTAIRDTLWPRYLEFQERIVTAIADTLRRGQRTGRVAADIEPDDEARLFVAAAYVVTQMKFAGAPPARVERFLRTLVRSAVGRYTTDDRKDARGATDDPSRAAAPGRRAQPATRRAR